MSCPLVQRSYWQYMLFTVICSTRIQYTQCTSDFSSVHWVYDFWLLNVSDHGNLRCMYHHKDICCISVLLYKNTAHRYQSTKNMSFAIYSSLMTLTQREYWCAWLSHVTFVWGRSGLFSIVHLTDFICQLIKYSSRLSMYSALAVH